MNVPRQTILNLRGWGRGKSRVKATDPVLKEALGTDIIIPIMGPTGVGKSKLINILCGSDVATVGHGLESCTAFLQPVTIEIPKGPFSGRRLILVDTPGFDDTYIDDSEILSRIARWLASSYQAGMILAGVVYLYDISQVRMLGTTRKNMEIFRKLCGNDSLSSVILATTKWEQIDQQVGENRETQLREKYWRDMIDHGSSMYRLENPEDSAWNMLYELLAEGFVESFQGTILQIQKEVVDKRKRIPDTEAGKHLRELLEKAVAQVQKTRFSDVEHSEAQSSLRMTLQALQSLKISLSLRILIFLGIA